MDRLGLGAGRFQGGSGAALAAAASDARTNITSASSSFASSPPD